MRDRRLGEVECRDEVAYAHLVGGGKPVHDRDASGISERLEARRELVAFALAEGRRAWATAENGKKG